MPSSFIEKQIENAVQEAVGDKAMSILRGVGKIASKQGGENTIENYQLLGKRVLIGVGVTLVVVQVTTSIVGLVLSRKNEEKRVERVVHRILEEERQKAEAEKEYFEVPCASEN